MNKIDVFLFFLIKNTSITHRNKMTEQSISFIQNLPQDLKTTIFMDHFAIKVMYENALEIAANTKMKLTARKGMFSLYNEVKQNKFQLSLGRYVKIIFSDQKLLNYVLRESYNFNFIYSHHRSRNKFDLEKDGFEKVFSFEIYDGFMKDNFLNKYEVFAILWIYYENRH